MLTILFFENKCLTIFTRYNGLEQKFVAVFKRNSMTIIILYLYMDLFNHI